MFDGFHIAQHQREWFFDATFALTQKPDRVRVRRITRQMKTAQSFDRDDFALRQKLLGLPNGVIAK
jgi:hypothetical protein